MHTAHLTVCRYSKTTVCAYTSGQRTFSFFHDSSEQKLTFEEFLLRWQEGGTVQYSTQTRFGLAVIEPKQNGVAHPWARPGYCQEPGNFTVVGRTDAWK